MDPDVTLGIARTMVRAWEEATDAAGEHAAARELSSAFGALDDYLSNGGILPAPWQRDRGGEGTAVLPMVREFILACDEAMAAESIAADVRKRLGNRLLWGNPDGPEGIRQEAARARSLRIHPSTGIYGEPGDPLLFPDAKFWHLTTGTPVGPELTHPVFGSDMREIDISAIDHEDIHPLIATCACGEEIMRHDPREPWGHSDPRA